MQLTSAQNPVLKAIRRAAATGQRTDDGLIVAEGPNLLKEALRSAWDVKQIYCTGEGRERFGDIISGAKAEIVEISSRALGSTGSTESHQDILTLLRPRSWSWPELLVGNPLLVVLDGIQDPGNAGTIVRSAEAFGATGLVFLSGSVRVSNGKFLRASAGSIFRTPFLDFVGVQQLLDKAAQTALPLHSLAMRRSVSISDAKLNEPCAIVVGSEGSGISELIVENSRAISIPTRHVESLNAAVACSLALFEASRQRSSR